MITIPPIVNTVPDNNLGYDLTCAPTKYIIRYSKSRETPIAVINTAIRVEFLSGLYAIFSMLIPSRAHAAIDIIKAGINPTLVYVVTANPTYAPTI